MLYKAVATCLHQKDPPQEIKGKVVASQRQTWGIQSQEDPGPRAPAQHISAGLQHLLRSSPKQRVTIHFVETSSPWRLEILTLQPLPSLVLQHQ